MDVSALEAMPLPTVLLEGDRISYANAALGELLGLSPAELVGRTWTELVAAPDRARMVERYGLRRAGAAVPVEYETTLLGAGGPVPAVVRVRLLPGGAIAQLVDLREEAARRELLASLARLGASVQRELSAAAVQRRVREGLLALGIRSTWAEAGPGVVRIAWAEMGPGPERGMLEAALGAPLAGSSHPATPFTDAILRDGGIFSDDWPAEVEAWFRLPIAAVLRELEPVGAYHRGLGLRVDAGGAASLLFAVGGWLRPEDLPAFQLFASQITAALEAARTVSALRARNDDLLLLNDIAVATSALDPALLLENALRRVCGTLGADAGAAFLVQGAELEPVALLGLTREDFDDAPAAALGLPRLVVARGAPMASSSPAFDESRRAWFHERLGLRAVIGVPLVAKERVLGSLVLGRRAAEAFDGSHARLLSSVGAQLGMAVEHARLFSDTQRRMKDLEAVNSLALRVFTTTPGDAPLLLHAACREIAEALGAGAAAILQLDADGRRLVGVAGFGTPLPPERLAVDLEATPVAADALRAQEPTWSPEVVFAQADGAAAPALSVLFVPLTSRAATRGLVAIADLPPRRFEEAEVALAYALASEAAMALENAELYAAERKRVEELSRLNDENARLYEDLRRSYAELARAQEQLIQQERLAALGQLAAVVAHEVRNPLGVIFNSLGTLRRLVQPQGDARMLFEIVGEEAERLNRIVGDLLDFARPSTPRLRPEPLDRVLDDAAGAALASATGVVLVRELAPDLPPVPMDARLMRQAVLNVAANAVQAMPAGGTLTVSARAEPGAVRVEIADTGCGIPEEVRHRIFEPFFTTRPTGTGLGLAVVKRILDDHRAAVQVESVEGGGTRFVLRLPLSDGVENGPPSWSRSP